MTASKPSTSPKSNETMRSFVLLRSEVSTVTTQSTTVLMVDTSPAKIGEVARAAIVALIDARDFLAYQLSHAQGGMTDEQLDAIADEYLRHETWVDAELQLQIRALAELIPDRLDAETVSTIFACDIEQASRVLASSAERAAIGVGETATALESGDHDEPHSRG